MLVLASASPRRKELLAQAGFSFRVFPSSVPEVVQPGEDPISFATRLSLEKALAVFGEHKDTLDSTDDPLLVLGADTVVVSETEILGKPRDPDDAARMLRMLSGRTHQVITGVSVISRSRPGDGGRVDLCVDAGAERGGDCGLYRVRRADGQGWGLRDPGLCCAWIPRIHGCYFNVVGLPLALAASLIDGMKLRLESAATAELDSRQM